MRDRDRAETLGVHLAQAARLEARRHENEVAAGEQGARIVRVEADADADGVAPARAERDELGLHLRLAAPHDDELAAEIGDAFARLEHEIGALLVDQPRDERKQRRAPQRQAEHAAHVVGVAALPALRIVEIGAIAVLPRVPGFVDAVEDAGQAALRGALGEQAVEPAAEFGPGDFLGVSGADGDDLRGIVQPGLEEGKAAENSTPCIVNAREGIASAPMREASNSP